MRLLVQLGRRGGRAAPVPGLRRHPGTGLERRAGSADQGALPGDPCHAAAKRGGGGEPCACYLPRGTRGASRSGRAPRRPGAAPGGTRSASRRCSDASSIGRGPGRPQPIAITGETGIGKSRVAHEPPTGATPARRPDPTDTVYETEQILQFGPWVGALRGRPTHRLGDALAGLRPAWRTELGRSAPAAPHRSLPAASAGALRLFQGWPSSSSAGRRPALTVPLEDLQWADQMSIRLLAFLWPASTRRPRCRGHGPRRGRRQNAPPPGETDELSAAATPSSSRSAHCGGGHRHLVRSRRGPPPARCPRSASGTPAKAIPSWSSRLVRAADAGAALDGNPSCRARAHREVVGRSAQAAGTRSPAVAGAATIGRRFDFALLRRAADVAEAEAAEGVEELVRGESSRASARSSSSPTTGCARSPSHSWSPPSGRPSPTGRRSPAGSPCARPASHVLAVATHYRAPRPGTSRRLLPASRGHRLRQIGSRERGLLRAGTDGGGGHARRPRRQRRASELHYSMGRALYFAGDFARSRKSFSQAESLAQALGDDRRRPRSSAASPISSAPRASTRPLSMRATSPCRRAVHWRHLLQAWTSVTLGRQHFALGEYARGQQLRGRWTCCGGRRWTGVSVLARCYRRWERAPARAVPRTAPAAPGGASRPGKRPSASPMPSGATAQVAGPALPRPGARAARRGHARPAAARARRFPLRGGRFPIYAPALSRALGGGVRARRAPPGYLQSSSGTWRRPRPSTSGMGSHGVGDARPASLATGAARQGPGLAEESLESRAPGASAGTRRGLST